MLDENASESTCVFVEWNHIISSFIRKEIMKKNSHEGEGEKRLNMTLKLRYILEKHEEITLFFLLNHYGILYMSYNL